MNGQANGHVRKRDGLNTNSKMMEVEKNGGINSSNHTTSNLTEKDEKLKEWQRTRRLGFLSFIIPVSIVVILSTKTFGGSTVQNVLHSTWGWEPVEKTILYFTLWAIKEVSMVCTTLVR